MAAGVTSRLWEIGDIVDVLEAWEASRAQMDKITDKIKEAQAKYRPPNPIKVLFVGESPPSNGKYFYFGCYSLLRQMRHALEEDQSTDTFFLTNFMNRGWYFDDLVQSPVKQSELRKACQEARNDLASRVRRDRPSIIVCLLRGIRDDVEAAALMADSDACVYAVSFPPQQPRAETVMHQLSRGSPITTASPPARLSDIALSVALLYLFCCKLCCSTRMTGQRSGIYASCDELTILNLPPNIR
jgi:hypothetical protein